MGADDLPIDTGSTSWRAVQAWADKQLTASHRALEATGLAQADTEYHRGRCAVLRELARLPQPSQLTGRTQ